MFLVDGLEKKKRIVLGKSEGEEQTEQQRNEFGTAMLCTS